MVEISMLKSGVNSLSRTRPLDWIRVFLLELSEK